MSQNYVYIILFISWQLMFVGFVNGIGIETSNSITDLDDDKIRIKRGTLGLSSAEQKEAVDIHNSLRANEQAADMKFMVSFIFK